MRHASCWFAVVLLITCTLGCASREVTFRVIDAETGKPLKGVYVGQRNVRTTTPADVDHVVWAFDTWHPFPTNDDGLFRCSFDDAQWHVLEFRDESCDGPKETDHNSQFATISPEQKFVLVGDWPKEGMKFRIDQVVTVKLQTYRTFWAWLRSPLNPGNQPASRPSTQPASERS
jgi:hypothetical protein